MPLTPEEEKQVELISEGRVRAARRIRAEEKKEREEEARAKAEADAEAEAKKKKDEKPAEKSFDIFA
jgi:hypothetical protein